MTKRLNILTSHISKGKIFADIGCDHGLISKFVLDNNLFEKVIATDISKKSLEKAKNLLKNYNERVSYIVCDGFDGFSETPCEVIIAGMGGEEIVKIISSSKYLPNRFILSPQKNQDKVRKLLISIGYKITNDYTFYDEKYYDVIVAVKGEDSYSDLEYKFGRDNIKNKPIEFINKLKHDKSVLLNVLNSKNLNSETILKVNEELSLIRGIINEN